MNSKEIESLAAWTAKSIKDTLVMDGRELDDAGEDIIREYVQSELKNYRLGERITQESSAQLVAEIISRRRNEMTTFGEVVNALAILSSKFPEFVEDNLRQREAEARIIASKMPAIKV